MKARTMAIARGEPTVWFAFIESFAKVLSGRDRELPALIAWEKPDSLTELAALAGSNKSNLSWTLKAMQQAIALPVGAETRGNGPAPRSAGCARCLHQLHQAGR